MSSLLEVLRQDAVQLVESDLPSQEELRSVTAALLQRLEKLAAGEITSLIDKAEQPTTSATVPNVAASGAQTQAAEAPVTATAPSDAEAAAAEQAAEQRAQQLSQAQADLQAAQQRVAALEAQDSPQSAEQGTTGQA